MLKQQLWELSVCSKQETGNISTSSLSFHRQEKLDFPSFVRIMAHFRPTDPNRSRDGTQLEPVNSRNKKLRCEGKVNDWPLTCNHWILLHALCVCVCVFASSCLPVVRSEWGWKHFESRTSPGWYLAYTLNTCCLMLISGPLWRAGATGYAGGSSARGAAAEHCWTSNPGSRPGQRQRHLLRWVQEGETSRRGKTQGNIHLLKVLLLPVESMLLYSSNKPIREGNTLIKKNKYIYRPIYTVCTRLNCWKLKMHFFQSLEKVNIDQLMSIRFLK